MIRIDELDVIPIDTLISMGEPVDLDYGDGIDRVAEIPELIITKLLNNFYKKWTGANMSKKNSIRRRYIGGLYNSKVLHETIEGMVIDIFNRRYINFGVMSEITSDIMHIFNELNNILGDLVPSSVVGIDILDMMEIQTDPDMIEAMEKVDSEPTDNNIRAAYVTLDKVFKSGKYADNPLTMLYVSGSAKAGQVRQALGPRGFTTDVNYEVYPYPVTKSFFIGLYDMYSLAIESSSAAKALVMSSLGIAMSEFFGRYAQLITMSVEKLIRVDCGSRHGKKWYVSPAEVIEGIETYKGDLSTMIGKRYKLHQEDEWSTISRTSDISGKEIILRDVQSCRLADKHHVCVECFGDAWLNIPALSNVGHFTTVTITAIISQLILATKHELSSSQAGLIALDPITAKYLTVKKNGLAFKKDVFTRYESVKLHIPMSDVFGLFNIVDTNNTDPGKVSKIDKCVLELNTKTGEKEYVTLQIRQGGRHGVLTKKFINFIIEANRLAIQYSDTAVVDITKWKSLSHFVTLPLIEFNFYTLLTSVRSLINKRHTKMVTPNTLLSKLFTLINSKINVNIAYVEIMVYALSVISEADNNYDLPRLSSRQEISTLDSIASNRTLGVTYAYGDLYRNIMNPETFYDAGKVDSIMDIFIAPQETVDYLDTVIGVDEGRAIPYGVNGERHIS